MPRPDVKHCLPACAAAGLHARLRLGLVRLLSLLLFLPGLAFAAPFAYIANSGSNIVSVIDTASNYVTAKVVVAPLHAGIEAENATNQ